MFSTVGRRVLTDAQVERILQWKRNRKTLGQVARENGVSCGTIYRVIDSGGQYKRALPLTPAELRRVLEWQRNRKTLIQVARENGVSTSTILAVIRTGGRYKRAAPPGRSLRRPKSERHRGRRR